MSGESRYANGARGPAKRHVARVAIALGALTAMLALSVAPTGQDPAPTAPDAPAEVAGVVVVRDDAEPVPDTDTAPGSAPAFATSGDEEPPAEAAGADHEALAATVADGENAPIIAAPSFDGWADLRVPEEQSLIEPDPEPEPEPEPESGAEPAAHREVEDTRAQEALAMISYPWADRLPGWSVTFEPARDGLRGLTFSGEARIEIYVRPDDSAWDLARVLAHELGHAVDLTVNDAGARRNWSDARGMSDDTPWWPSSGLADFATGAGDFAECFATWQMGSASLSQAAGPCSAADLELLASMV